MGTIEKVLAGTLMAIVLYLLLKDAGAANTIISSGANAYVSGVKALQGR